MKDDQIKQILKYEIYRKRGDSKQSEIIEAKDYQEASAVAQEKYPDGDGWNVFVGAKEVYDWHEVTYVEDGL